MSIDVICLGEALIDLFAPVGVSLQEAATFHRAPGGAPANVAAGLGKLGVPVGFIGTVGQDHFGRLLQKTLAEAGVDTTCLHLTDQANTTLAWVAQPDENTSEFLFYRNPGADTLLSTEDLEVDYLQQARILHFGSVSLSREPARSATLEAIRLARANGALISYDPNWRPRLWADPQAGLTWIRQGSDLADLVKVNQAELALITGESELNRGAQKLLDLGIEWVVVTLGDAGAFYATRSVSGLVPGLAVAVVDTTGCGDAFMAALLYCLRQVDRPLETRPAAEVTEMVTFANAAGAVTATRKGAIPALPSLAEIESMLGTRIKFDHRL